MREDKEEFIPETKDKQNYTLAEAYELLRKQEQEHERPCLSEV